MSNGTAGNPASPETASLPRRVADRMAAAAGTDTFAAALLLAATLAALLWVNSPWGDSYTAFWHTEVALRWGDAVLSLDLRHWVNDGLMAVFFFVVGLEVRRELVMGELTDRRSARTPLAAAIAGLAVPAGLFLILNPHGAASGAWGVVISTDTAFLLGVLALVVPYSAGRLRPFLLALAVADDIGALMVIALFYTDELSLAALVPAVLGLLAVAVLARFGQWRGPAYLVFSVMVWLSVYASGVHPTIAGVAIALLMPVYPPRRAEVEDAALLARRFRQSPSPEYGRLARLGMERAVSINERLYRLWSPWSTLVIVPLFAVANAGVRLDGPTLAEAARSPLTWGIVLGLVAGKTLGITGASALAVRLGGVLPSGLRLPQLAGGAALSGIGFTISLFIIDLALEDPALQNQARIGVLLASALAVLCGWLISRVAERRESGDGEAAPSRLVVPVTVERDHIRGPADAPLTLVEYADFECPFCGRATGGIEEVRRHFGDRLRYVFRHHPLPDVHPHAESAALASEAAAAQGSFWEMHDRLFAHADALTYDDLLEHAAALGLDTERFDRDMRLGVRTGRVRDDAATGRDSGVRGTPTFFIGDRLHEGPHDAVTLIEQLTALENGRSAPN
ncbi:Na+/H+ antiporter NhaA [Streptomyces sp. ODS28]|uniref:Na+/H+ antiporter NhaA n=1 Tax=Streptomyces sp. ODS28 TaxID=3136688 RepID=UPI0031E89853